MQARGYRGEAHLLETYACCRLTGSGSEAAAGISVSLTFRSINASCRNPRLHLENVVFRYGAVRRSMDSPSNVNQGESVALLGANGCGKSTLLRLAGLSFPPSGRIASVGTPLTRRNALRTLRFQPSSAKSAALLFQNCEVQFFNATVFDELAFGPLQLEWPRDQSEKQFRICWG